MRDHRRICLTNTDNARHSPPHGARLLSLYDQATFSEGPAWWPARDRLVWSDVEGRRALGWREDGRVEVVVDATPFTNGHAIDREGNLIHCEHGTRRLARTRPDGRYEAVVASYEGRRLDAPDDVICTEDGALWFTARYTTLSVPRRHFRPKPPHPESLAGKGLGGPGEV